jgi:transcription antitermination factor NusG
MNSLPKEIDEPYAAWIPWGDSVLHRMWFAVYTRSRHEQAVKKQLDGKGIESFLPLYEKKSRWKDRVKQIRLPLFPGYLFVHVPMRDRLKVVETTGVVNIVSNGLTPLPIPESQILNVQTFVESGLKTDPHPYMKVGRRVRIIEGPLNGVEGILVRKKSHSCLVLSIDMIQRSVSVELESWKIEAI